MSTEKARIKDLSAELGISNKELLQALRELNIPARSHMSTLTPEETEEIRARFKGSTGKTEVVRKEIQPGVIVRRRRKTVATDGTAEVEVHDEAVEEAVLETPALEEVEVETAPVAEVEAPSPAEPEEVAEPEASKAQTPGARVIAAPGARIVKPVQEQAKAPAQHVPVDEEPVTAEPVVEAAAEEEGPAPARVAPTEAVETEAPAPVVEQAEPAPATEPVTAAPVQAASESAAASEEGGEGEEGEDEEARKARKKRKKKPVISSEPQVRIISRPDPAAEPPKPAVRVVERPAPGRPGERPAPARPGERPAPARPGERPTSARPAPRPAAGRPPMRPAPGGAPTPAPGAAPEEDGRGKKKQRKDRRVVEFPQSGVGSEEDRRKASLQVKKKKTQEVRDKTGGKIKTGRRRPGFQDYAQESAAEQSAQPLKASKRKIRIDEAIRLQDLAHQMGVKAQSLIKVLFGLGIMATINQSLDTDSATLVAAEFGYEVEQVGFSEDSYLVPQQADAPEDLKGRPPVVTIMGHVDHGKTSLLDAIRQTNVTLGEAGGITQHIGAYHVATERGEVVFLDTPGHEAFTAMRARGAKVTDIVVLVVAADDGVMDQTREAVNHAKAAGVPIMVAVNKIDKEGADPDRARRELAELGLLAEDWGGETIFANVSAKQRIGIDELLELILLQAEVLELKANPSKPARGRIVEARLDKGRGAVATVLIQEGTLRQGDYFVCGLYNGRVRAMFNDQGKKVREAGPAMPVEVQGFEGVPEAGDEFAGVEDEKVARRIAEARQLKDREKTLAKESKVTLETFLSLRAGGTEQQSLNLVVKADVQGSLEAVCDALVKLSTDEVKVNLIHGGTGAITETDIMLASASSAIIIGFNVRPTAKVKDVAEREKIDIRFYDIIYKLVGEIKDAMSGMLSPLTREVYLGQAEVRETFSVPKVGIIAGCGVSDGKILRNAGVRLLRDGVVIYTGKISSLKRFKDDVKEVAKGYECGIGLENFNDIKVGDVIEAFEEVQEARTLE